MRGMTGIPIVVLRILDGLLAKGDRPDSTTLLCTMAVGRHNVCPCRQQRLLHRAAGRDQQVAAALPAALTRCVRANTGTNACYIEQLGAISKWLPHYRPRTPDMVVNIEWPGFRRARRGTALHQPAACMFISFTSLG